MDGEADPYRRARTRVGCAVRDMVQRWVTSRREVRWAEGMRGEDSSVLQQRTWRQASWPVVVKKGSTAGFCRSREAGGSQNHIEEMEVSERWRRRRWAGVQRCRAAICEVSVSGRLLAGRCEQRS